MAKNLVVASTNWRKSDLVAPFALWANKLRECSRLFATGVNLAWYLFAKNVLLISGLLIRIFVYTCIASTNILLVWSNYAIRRFVGKSR